LTEAIDGLPGCKYFVVGLGGQSAKDGQSQVMQHMVADEKLTVRRAAEALNSGDIAVIQHEYHIDRGADVEELLEVHQLLRVPWVIVLHSVLSSPSSGQQRILEEACESTAGIITMSRAARDRLLLKYRIEPSKVVVIPQGANPIANAITPILNRILIWGPLRPGQADPRAVQGPAMPQYLAPHP
jgi:hypothetical protein